MSEIKSEAGKLLSIARTTLLLVGVVAVIAGIVILVWPERTAALMFGGILAAYLIIAGIVYLGMGFFAKDSGGWARAGHFLLALVYIAAGVVIFLNLSTTTIVIAVFVSIVVGITWILDGIVALSLLGSAESKGWTLFYAALSVIGGVVLLLWPFLGEQVFGGALVLWMVFGITLIVLGVAQILRAVFLGKVAKEVADLVD